MTARVLFGNDAYYSPVLAVSWRRGKSEAVILDHSGERLIVVPIFGNGDYPAIFFTDFNTEGYAIVENDFKSFFDDKKIIKTVKKGKYSTEMLATAQTLAKGLEIEEHVEINSPDRLRAFETTASYFHDGSVLGIAQRGEKTEILFDSGWGAIIHLICEGVKENQLNLGDFFFDCDIKIEDGEVKLTFVPMNGNEDLILRANSISYKPLFRKRAYISDIIFSDNGKDFSIYEEDILPCPDILDFEERSVIGYLDSESPSRLLIFSRDVVYCFYELLNDKKKQSEFDAATSRIIEAGYMLDDYCVDEDYEFDLTESLGEVIYTREYTHANWLLTNLSYIFPGLLFYNLIWLIAQLANPEMTWLAFFIFGLGSMAICLVTLLVVHFSEWLQDRKNGTTEKRVLEICEEGIMYRGYNSTFSARYESIEKIEHRVCITLTIGGVKSRLHPTRADHEIYKIISEKIDKKKKTDVDIV